MLQKWARDLSIHHLDESKQQTATAVSAQRLLLYQPSSNMTLPAAERLMGAVNTLLKAIPCNHVANVKKLLENMKIHINNAFSEDYV